MRYLLDTNIVSELLKKRPSGKVLNFFLAHESVCAIPAIVVAERFHGAYLSPPERRVLVIKEIEELCLEFLDRILPFDATAAAVGGEYVSRDALRKQPRSYPDTQIAAIALANNLILVTRNTEVFPEVQTINPFV